MPPHPTDLIAATHRPPSRFQSGLRLGIAGTWRCPLSYVAFAALLRLRRFACLPQFARLRPNRGNQQCPLTAARRANRVDLAGHRFACSGNTARWYQERTAARSRPRAVSMKSSRNRHPAGVPQLRMITIDDPPGYTSGHRLRRRAPPPPNLDVSRPPLYFIRPAADQRCDGALFISEPLITRSEETGWE